MPLTAVDPNGVVIDSTDCPEPIWSALHRNKAGGMLCCRECAGRMVAKVSVTGLRFFAHYRRPDECSAQSETAEHRELKRSIAELIRAAGGEALIEATPLPTDEGGWRADVLAVTPDGLRVAFEVQLAGMTVDEGEARSEKYQRDGISVLWVTTRHAHWLLQIPSVKVQRHEDGPWEVVRGTARLHADRLHWEPSGPVPFDKVVSGLLADRVTPCGTRRYFYEDINGRLHETHSPVLIVSRQQRVAYEEALAEEERAVAKRAAEREAHRQNIEALYARQETLLQAAVMDAVEHAQAGERLWLGVPPDPWMGDLPVSLKDALGNEKTAMGAVIWIGASESEKRLWAVICPVAGRANPGLGRSWSKRGVTVYAASRDEAVRLAGALGWTLSDIRLVRQ